MIIETWLHQDINEPVKVNYLNGNLFTNNGNGNRINVILTSNGQAVSVSGTVSGYVVTADGSTVPCTGSKSGNRASILIPAAAYQPGPIFITVFVTDGTQVTTIGAVSSTVLSSRTNAQVDPGSVVTDWTQTINAAMQAVQTAAANLANIVAVPYASITFPVPLGKYTVYNDNLYRCITPIASSESFTAAHWTQVRLGDDVSDLKSALAQEFDASKAYQAGEYVTYNSKFYKITVDKAAGTAWAQTGTERITVDEIAQSILAITAPAFDKSTVYAVGDHVNYNGNLYRITTPHASGTAWAQTGTERITVDSELVKLWGTINEAGTDITGTVYNGIYITTGGVITDNLAYQTTDFIDVEGLGCVFVSGTMVSACGVIGYTANHEKVSNLLDYSFIGSGINTIISYPVIIPSTVKYIRACSAYYDDGRAHSDIKVVAFGNPNNEKAKLYNVTTINGKYLKTDNTTGNSNDYQITDYLAVKPGERYAFGFTLGSGMGLLGYNADRTSYSVLFSRTTSGNNNDAGTIAGRTLYTYVELEIPSGVYYIRGTSAFAGSSASYSNIPFMMSQPIGTDVRLLYKVIPPFAYGWTAVGENPHRVLYEKDAVITLPEDAVHLYPGDIVRLTDYSNARFCYGYIDSNGVVGAAWRQGDTIITNEGDYVFMISNPTYQTLTSIDSLAVLFEIYSSHKHSDMHKIDEADGKYQIIASSLKTFNTDEIPAVDDNGIKFVHITDIHGDSVRFQSAMEYAKKIGVDFVIATGDIVALDTSSDYSFFVDAVNKYGIPLFPVIGNHEAKAPGAYNPPDECFQIPNSTKYSNYINPIKAKIGNPVNTWYSYDFASEYLKLIVLDCYDSQSTYTEWFMNFSQTQIDFLLDELDDAISKDYAVLIAMHEQEYFIHGAEGISDFCQRSDGYGGVESNKKYTGYVISDIVKAFIDGDTLTQNYTLSKGFSVSIDHSFSNQGKFAGYLTGHRHGDFTGIPEEYPGQLSMNITCGLCKSLEYGYTQSNGRFSDLPREVNTKTENAFNVVCINKSSRKTTLIRIGSDKNDLLQDRNYEQFQF